MKIRMLKDILVEVEKPRLQEIWDKQLIRWQELTVDKVTVNGTCADILLDSGDVLIGVPVTSFSTV